MLTRLGKKGGYIMSKLFEAAMGNQESSNLRASLVQRYANARSNLLIAVILTGLNILMPIFGADIYMLFSIFTPTFLTSLAMLICGKYPPEYYAEAGMDGFMFYDDAVFFAMVAAAVVITLIFLIFWALSHKSQVGWLIAAAVLFGIDGLMIFLLGGFDFAYTIDILFHAWVLYALINGIIAHFKLKNLPEENGDILDAFAQPDNDFV